MSGHGTFLHHVELREGSPGCPLGTPKNLGFSRVPGPDFRAWAPSHTLPSGHFWVGLETPKIIVFQAHPGPLELRIMAFLAPPLVPFLGLRRGPSKPLFGGFLEGFPSFPREPFQGLSGALCNSSQIGPLLSFIQAPNTGSNKVLELLQ